MKGLLWTESFCQQLLAGACVIPSLQRASGDWGGEGYCWLIVGIWLPAALFEGMWSFNHSEWFVISSPISVWESSFCSSGRAASFIYFYCLGRTDPHISFLIAFIHASKFWTLPLSTSLAGPHCSKRPLLFLDRAVTHRVDSGLWVELRILRRGLEKPGLVQGLCVTSQLETRPAHRAVYPALCEDLGAGSIHQASSPLPLLFSHRRQK